MEDPQDQGVTPPAGSRSHAPCTIRNRAPSRIEKRRRGQPPALPPAPLPAGLISATESKYGRMPHNGLQNIMEPTGLPAAFKMSLARSSATGPWCSTRCTCTRKATYALGPNTTHVQVVDSSEPRFTSPAYKLKHGHSAAQTPPEHYGTEWFLSCFQEGVELTPLRRGRDAPLDVPVHDGRLVHLDSTLRM